MPDTEADPWPPGLDLATAIRDAAPFLDHNQLCSLYLEIEEALTTYSTSSRTASC